MTPARFAAWIPTWDLACLQDSAGSGTPYLDRVGGRPWGLPVGSWPSCTLCETPMRFIAQFAHHAERLDLGASGNVLFVFLCMNPRTSRVCGLQAGTPGDTAAHAVFVAPAQPASAPTAATVDTAIHGPGLVAMSWARRDDRCDPARADALIYGLTEEAPSWPEGTGAAEDAPDCTKIGGVPLWLQDPFFQGAGDPRAYRYTAQVRDWHSLPDDRFLALDWVRAQLAEPGERVDRVHRVGLHEVTLRTFATSPGCRLLGEDPRQSSRAHGGDRRM